MHTYRRNGKEQITEDSITQVGRRLRLVRKALKLNQSALCRLTGITDQAWNNAETGDNLLTVPNAVKFCQVTGVTMDWIYRGQVTALPSTLLAAITKPKAEGTS